MANLIVQTDPNLERRRQLAMEMMQAGQSGAPVQAWTQGANRILQSLLGAYNLRQAEQEQNRQQQLGQETVQQALSQFQGQSQPMMAAEGMPFDLGQPKGSPQERFAQVLAEGPYTSQFGTEMLLQQQAQQQQAQAEEAQRQAELERQKELARFKAEQESTSQFQGTGVEQQMLNILLDQNIPDTDPRKQLARQRLSRPTTTVTPSGTYIQPGYDVNAALGGEPTQQREIPPGFTPKPATGEEKKVKGYYDRMVNASNELSSLGNYNPVSNTEAVRGLTNVTASPEKQRYQQAAADWIRAKLRRESGAVIAPEEMASEYTTYFPVYGDSPEVLAQKARARKQAEQAMLDAGPKQKGADEPSRPKTQAEFDALNSGDLYIDPDDGKLYRKQ